MLSEPMSSGSFEDMQIRLKIEPGSVQGSVRLEHSILSIQIAKQNLTVKQCLLDKLERTNLSFDVDVREPTLQQPIFLEYTNFVQEKGTFILQIADLVKTEPNLHYLEKATIHQEFSLFPGVEVQKKDKRFGWNGVIVEQAEENVLVDWGAGASPRLHSIDEICLRQDARINIFKIALRGRKAILSESIVENENTLKIVVKKELAFRTGDLVKLVDPYHHRANDTGLIESYNNDGECIVRWQSDNSRQVEIPFRTFCADELMFAKQTSFL